MAKSFKFLLQEANDARNKTENKKQERKEQVEINPKSDSDTSSTLPAFRDPMSGR